MGHRLDELGVQTLRLDIASFPLGSSLTLMSRPESSSLSAVRGLPELFGDGAPGVLQKRRATATHVDLRDVASVWVRRPRGPLVAPEIAAERFRRFAAANMMAALRGWLAACNGQPRVVNNRTAEDRAEIKWVQLSVAAACGLAVPETCVSNEPAVITGFVDSVCSTGREVVYKPLLATHDASQGTQLVDHAALAHIETVVHAPTVFQERIIGSDIRAVVVGSSVFAIEEVAQTEDGAVDIRAETAPLVSPHFLGEDTVRTMLKVHRALGLDFGAYDLKRDGRGDIWFLEVNPSGQWLWVETAGGHPIAESLARLLAFGNGAETEVRGLAFDRSTLGALEPESTSEAYKRAVSQRPERRR